MFPVIGGSGRRAAALRTLILAALLLAQAFSAVRPAFAQDQPAPLAERARGAERVVVGLVQAVEPSWRVNEFGDRLIVSTLRVVSEETLKGQPASAIEIELEGGTLDGVTLKVSDLPTFSPGERAVFFLRQNTRGRLVPHLRGQGLLKLDGANRVPGGTLTLAEIRRVVAAGR